MLIYYKGREIDIELENVTYDYKQWCDTYIEKAYYTDSGTELTGEEMDDLQENGDMDKYVREWLY